jgi:hypothetical protein
MTVEQADRIIELLESINSHMPMLVQTSSLLHAYGLVYVPLIVIVLMLWWFFRQFIYTY